MRPARSVIRASRSSGDKAVCVKPNADNILIGGPGSAAIYDRCQPRSPHRVACLYARGPTQDCFNFCNCARPFEAGRVFWRNCRWRITYAQGNQGTDRDRRQRIRKRAQ
jgi:hypothetical protein